MLIGPLTPTEAQQLRLIEEIAKLDTQAMDGRNLRGNEMSVTELLRCDLCGDQGPLLLAARCHLTAPLAVELDGCALILRCYLPKCRSEVARFTVARGDKIERLERDNAALLAAAKLVIDRGYRDHWGVCMRCGADMDNKQDHDGDCSYPIVAAAIAQAEAP